MFSCVECLHAVRLNAVMQRRVERTRVLGACTSHAGLQCCELLCTKLPRKLVVVNLSCLQFYVYNFRFLVFED